MTLTFEQVRAIDDLDRERVSIPAWGGEVVVRMLRADERSDLEAVAMKHGTTNPGLFRRELLARTLVNDDGSPWLKSEDDVRVLMEKSAANVELAVEVALRLNGFKQEDVEELEKN